jgi:hypothetical protein
VQLSFLEKQEFAAPGAFKELYCKGRLCAICGKCRDWYYTGDQTSWQWIQNCRNWKSDDWNRYNKDRVYDRFKRRNGATCTFGYFGDGCLCDDNMRN